jgi:hypothetical protein
MISICWGQLGRNKAYLRCLQGPQDRGTRLRLRTTLNWGSGGEWPEFDDVVEGGVGGISSSETEGSELRLKAAR